MTNIPLTTGYEAENHLTNNNFFGTPQRYAKTIKLLVLFSLSALATLGATGLYIF